MLSNSKKNEIIKVFTLYLYLHTIRSREYQHQLNNDNNDIILATEMNREAASRVKLWQHQQNVVAAGSMKQRREETIEEQQQHIVMHGDRITSRTGKAPVRDNNLVIT